MSRINPVIEQVTRSSMQKYNCTKVIESALSVVYTTAIQCSAVYELEIAHVLKFNFYVISIKQTHKDGEI